MKGFTSIVFGAILIAVGVIYILGVLGIADIIVPENVNIRTNTFCLFGGISDEREIKNTDKDALTLDINGFCILGGADIK